jgi:hypothetical protein
LDLFLKFTQSYPQLRKFGTNKSFVRLDRKLGNSSAAALDFDARLATSVRSIALLLAVLTSHLRALDDFITHRYDIRRAAPSFADFVRLARRHLIHITRLSPQGGGHAVVVPGIKGDKEATFAVSGGSRNAFGRRYGGVGHAN